MRLVWSGKAIDDRREIYDYSEADDPRAGIEVDERIEAASRHLSESPEMGRVGRVAGTREPVIARTHTLRPMSSLSMSWASCG